MIFASGKIALYPGHSLDFVGGAGMGPYLPVAKEKENGPLRY
jgi:hypothetical protein